MTKTQAIALIKLIPGMTARSTYEQSGDRNEIRINFLGYSENTACYATDPEDAVHTANAMAFAKTLRDAEGI